MSDASPASPQTSGVPIGRRLASGMIARVISTVAANENRKATLSPGMK